MMRRLRDALSRLLAFAVILALAACDGTGNPTAPGDESLAPADAQPSLAPESPAYVGTALTLQRIAFMSSRKGANELYKVDPQGNSVARLTFTADGEQGVAWSYDNKRIATVRKRPDGNVSRDDIYLMNADGSNGHWARSTPSPYYLGDPSWSPDGSRLVLTVGVNGGYHLGWMDLATGQIGLFNAAAGGWLGYRPSYDPTGKKIVYVGNRRLSIEQISADGSVHKVLIASTRNVGDPSFSPDGKKLAYTKEVPDRLSVADPNLEVFVKDYAAGTTARLTKSPSFDFAPTWSPDGSRIAFTSKRSGQLQVWTMNAAGGELLRITHSATDESYPAWSH
jgi:TolB protein